MRLISEILLKILGLISATLAIALNPLFIGRVLVGRSIENIVVVAIIIFGEIILALLGIALFCSPDFFIKKKKEIALFVIVSLISLGALELTAKLVWQSPMGGWYGYPPGLYEPPETIG